MSQQLDSQGEAHEALGSAVNSYGQRVLNDPHILGNLVTDLLPDLPRERNLLVMGAEARVAADISQHVDEQHIDPDTAVHLAARSLSEGRSIDPAASMWVATEYAQALGYQVRPYAEAAQVPPQSAPPPIDPTMTARGGQPTPTLAQPQQPVTQPPWQVPQAQPGAPVMSGTQPPPQGPPTWQSWPSPPPGQSWPPPQPTGRPQSSWSGRRGGIAIGGAVAGLVVIFLIVAAVTGIAPFKSSPAAVPTPTHKPTPVKPKHSATPTPTASLAAGVTPLSQLLPSDIADPTTECTPVKPNWTSPGLVSALSCNDTNLPSGFVNAYQMDSTADYDKAWQNFNSWLPFDTTSAGSTCPPTSTGGQGMIGWNNSTDGFPEMPGQVLECWMGPNDAPAYAWAMPTQDAFIIAQAANGSTFKALDTWWTDNANPTNAVPSPSPTSS